MSWNLLERLIKSEHFNKDPSLTVAYLARYADHVGIQHVLCSKLRQFRYEEIEFYLPQLCHLLLSLDNESMALEEFMIDLCEESANAALLAFWLLQTYLRDLSSTPTSNAFRKCRRIYNRIQRIVYGSPEPQKREKIRDNILPVSVLGSLVLASVAAPFLPGHAGPVAIAQARKPRPVEQIISEGVQAQRPTRSHTVSGNARPRRARPPALDGQAERPPRRPHHRTNLSIDVAGPRSTSSRTLEARSPRRTLLDTKDHEGYISSHSLPDTRPAEEAKSRSPVAEGPGPEQRRPTEMQRRHSHVMKVMNPSTLSPRQKIRLLRSNYFRLEAQFLSALEDISNRLVAVPKPARLSALRAELALIAQDLPAEVDIPLICPATLEDGSPSKSRHHRVVRLNPAEATSLNSAERVPYLLMIEILREDFDFDPDSPQNNELVSELAAEKVSSNPKRRRFDITDAFRSNLKSPEDSLPQDSVFEPSMGDLASPDLLKILDQEAGSGRQSNGMPPLLLNGALVKSPGLASNVSTTGSSSFITPRTSGQFISRSTSPAQRLSLGQARSQSGDQTDFNALATHMRTASQMLAQLELSSSKRPKAEVAAIKAKIIASMQSLEEQSFMVDEVTQASSFEAIVDNANNIGSRASPEDISSEPETSELDPSLATSAGAARMENDIKIGGVQRTMTSSDRDDPSAATFGEAWSAKRERIRRSSPYGWMKNWDLVSVIVKTGADLRQEAFACQLIDVCSKIWAEANVDVWVKRMRILVTGESSGLIETITNGVSLHSLKRSLTLSSIAAGTNPRKRIATLKDHFVRTFGPVDSPAHLAAAENFARSLAAYSVISYVLQLKDRHNGNILIDDRGHIVHIDFGFMLSNTPGSMGFEAAPFKLTADYLEVLSPSAPVNTAASASSTNLAPLGPLSTTSIARSSTPPVPQGSSMTNATTTSQLPPLPSSPPLSSPTPPPPSTTTSANPAAEVNPAHKLFVAQTKAAFQALRRDADRLITLVELMGRSSRMPCYASGVTSVVAQLRQRFVLDKSEREAAEFVEELIAKAAGSYYTRLYDTFQYRTQGIY